MTRVMACVIEKTDPRRLSPYRKWSYEMRMRMTTERTHNLVVRVAADELALMRRLAEIAREPAATLVRRWIRQHAEALGISTTSPIAETVTTTTNRRRTR